MKTRTKANTKILIFIFIFSLSFCFGTNITFAIQTSDLQPAVPADTINYLEPVYTNSSLKVEKPAYFLQGVHIGQQGTGGVAYLNGTIVNATTTNDVDNPVTFGDNVRIDGALWRGLTQGPGDAMPVKIMDDMYIAGALTGDDSVAVNDNLEVTGDIVLNSGKTVDGVDISQFKVSNITDLTATASELDITSGGISFSELQGSATDAQIPDDITASNYLSLAGGTMSGNLVMGGNSVSNIGTLTATTVNAVALQQGGVAIDSIYVNEAGDTMAGALDMNNQILTNIGVAGTDFSSTGGLTLADDLVMSGNDISSVGILTATTLTDGTTTMSGGVISDGAGTTISGGVVTANTISDGTASMSGGTIMGTTLTDGTATLSGGNLTGAGTVNATILQQGGVAIDSIYVNEAGDTMAGALDMNNQILTNIGVAGTDFSSTGGLTLADTLTVSAGGIQVATLTPGSVLFAGIGGLLSQDNALFWDNTNKRLGIGTTTPTYRLDVFAPANTWKARFGGSDGYILIGPANAGGAHIYTDRPRIIFDKPVYTTGNAFGSYGDLLLQTGGATTRIFVKNSDGNVGIGTTSPGAKLEVAGSVVATSDIRAQTNRFLPQVLFHDTTSSTATGSGFRTLKSFTVPGGTLGTANSIRVTAWVRRTRGSGRGQFQVTYGGSPAALMAGLSPYSPAELEIILEATGAANRQRGFIHHSNSASSGLGTGTTTVNSTINQPFALQVDLEPDTDVWTCDYILAEVIK